MSTFESIPKASLLLHSLRSVGYSEESAIADIVDNSISAHASEIKIDFSWENQEIVIVDNGLGMDKDSLYENMKIGSSDPNDARDDYDLGRFGMGLKTASLSLGKQLVVVTKKEGITSNASWDLDKVDNCAVAHTCTKRNLSFSALFRARPIPPGPENISPTVIIFLFI